MSVLGPKIAGTDSGSRRLHSMTSYVGSIDKTRKLWLHLSVVASACVAMVLARLCGGNLIFGSVDHPIHLIGCKMITKTNSEPLYNV